MKAAINRNVEHQVLRGGNPRLARDSWSHPAERLPLLDEQSTRYPSSRARKRKKGKAKERCNGNPNGHTHEWMKDTEEVPVYRLSYVRERYSPALAAIVGHEYWHRQRRRQVGTEPVLYRLCVHCGKVQYKKRGGWTTRERGYRELWTDWSGRKRIY